MTAQQAIDRSCTHDEIVTFDAPPNVIDDLYAECDDSCDLTVQYGYIDFWGGDKDNQWRVQARPV